MTVHQQKLLKRTDGKKSKTITSAELRVQSESSHIISEATVIDDSVDIDYQHTRDERERSR